MLYQVFDPPSHLAPYVRFFWALEADVAAGEEFVHRSMADGSVEIVFHYRGTFDELLPDGTAERSPLSNIQAQSTSFRRFSTNTNFGLFGTYLFPFAIPKLFGIPATELTNLSPDLSSIFAREGGELTERMITALNNEDRVLVMSGFLTEKLMLARRDLPPIFRSVHQIMDSSGSLSINDLATNFNISKRQFERKFKELAGLSPKLYSRVIRFQAATRHKVSGSRDLTAIAYDCGYYDQSHFINDFKEFSGYTPKEYFWSQAEGSQYMDAD